MQKRIIKKLENAKGTGCGYKHDRKSQHKRFRKAISDQMIREGLIGIDTRIDRLFWGILFKAVSTLLTNNE